MPVDVSQIQTKTWSMNVSKIGEVVTNLEDIKQSIALIVCTVKGSVPLMPTFGCGIYQWLDEPILIAAPKMVRDIRNAINQWEPRLRTFDVSYTFDNIQNGSALFTLSFTISAGISLQSDPVGTVFMGFILIGNGLYLVDESNRKILTQLGYILIK